MGESFKKLCGRVRYRPWVTVELFDNGSMNVEFDYVDSLEHYRPIDPVTGREDWREEGIDIPARMESRVYTVVDGFMGRLQTAAPLFFAEAMAGVPMEPTGWRVTVGLPLSKLVADAIKPDELLVDVDCGYSRTEFVLTVLALDEADALRQAMVRIPYELMRGETPTFTVVPVG